MYLGLIRTPQGNQLLLAVRPSTLSMAWPWLIAGPWILKNEIGTWYFPISSHKFLPFKNFLDPTYSSSYHLNCFLSFTTTILKGFSSLTFSIVLPPIHSQTQYKQIRPTISSPNTTLTKVINDLDAKCEGHLMILIFFISVHNSIRFFISFLEHDLSLAPGLSILLALLLPLWLSYLYSVLKYWTHLSFTLSPLIFSHCIFSSRWTQTSPHLQ